MHFGKSAGNFGGSVVRRPVGHDSAAAMSKLVALLPNYMQVVQNWSEKGVVKRRKMEILTIRSWTGLGMVCAMVRVWS